jgi:hypothetical protein
VHFIEIGRTLLVTVKVWSARGSLLVLGLGLFAACGSAERDDRGRDSDDAGEGGSAEAGSAGSVAARGGSAGSDSSAGNSGSAGSASGSAGSAGRGGTAAGGDAGSGGSSEDGGEPGSGGSTDAGGNGASGSSGAGAGGGGGTCNGEPVSVLFLIDTSRSNDDGMLGGGEPKWPLVRDVLMAAFDELPSTLNAGLLFFPQVSSAMMPPCFEVNEEIPIAPFDAAQQQAFSTALQSVVPDGGTPTYDAYDYVTQELEALDTVGPRVIVLVTDGVPNYLPECNGDAIENVEWDTLVAMVEAANEGGIHTMAVASPYSPETYPMLEAIATAGGSLGVCSGNTADGCFFDMDASFDLGPWLVESLAKLTENCTP